MENRQGFARLLGSAAHALARNEVHGHGDGGGGNPHMNVGAAGAEFVDVDAYHSFAHGIRACENKGSAKSEGSFREYHHGGLLQFEHGGVQPLQNLVLGGRIKTLQVLKSRPRSDLAGRPPVKAGYSPTLLESCHTRTVFS